MDDKHWIIVTADISATLDQVWEKWTQGAHVVNWNFAHHSWCCPRATSDFKVGGISSYRMEAKDGSMGFDLNATFTQIEPHTLIASVLEDGRKVEVRFSSSEEGVHVEQRFEPESQNSRDLQQKGWQAILDQFKTYCQK